MLIVGMSASGAEAPDSASQATSKPALATKSTPGLRREVMDAYAAIKGVVKYQTDIDPVVKKYITPDLTLSEAQHILENSGFTVVQFKIPPSQRSKYQVRMVGCICNINTRQYLKADIIVVIQSIADKATDVSGKIVVPDN
jgi:hypothetical protein